MSSPALRPGGWRGYPDAAPTLHVVRTGTGPPPLWGWAFHILQPVSAGQLAERGVGPELRRLQDAVIAERLEPILNELGRDGWELVQVGGLNQSARADVRDLLLILKRPKRP